MSIGGLNPPLCSWVRQCVSYCQIIKIRSCKLELERAKVRSFLGHSAPNNFCCKPTLEVNWRIAKSEPAKSNRLQGRSRVLMGVNLVMKVGLEESPPAVDDISCFIETILAVSSNILLHQ